MESSFADDEVLDFALAVRKSGGSKSGAAHTKIKTEMRRPARSIGPPDAKKRPLISFGCIAAFSRRKLRGDSRPFAPPATANGHHSDVHAGWDIDFLAES